MTGRPAAGRYERSRTAQPQTRCSASRRAGRTGPDRPTRGPLAWMARHRVAPNLLMVVLLLGGLLMTTQIRQEVFPEFSSDNVIVQVPYPGASPSEVEQGVILAIEEAVQGIVGVEEVTSTAREGSGTVTAEVQQSADYQRVYQDIRQAVDSITTFPDDAEEPELRSQEWRRDVLDMQVYGDVSRDGAAGRGRAGARPADPGRRRHPGGPGGHPRVPRADRRAAGFPARLRPDAGGSPPDRRAVRAGPRRRQPGDRQGRVPGAAQGTQAMGRRVRPDPGGDQRIRIDRAPGRDRGGAQRLLRKRRGGLVQRRARDRDRGLPGRQ